MARKIQGGALVPVALFNATGQKIESNGSTGAIAVIDSTHLNIHSGITFYSSYKSPNASPIGDDANFDILIRTLDNTTHMIFGIAAGGDSELLLYEASTFSDAGTAMPESNMNRRSNTVAQTTITHTPTITGVGNLLLNFFQPGGTGGGQSTGDSGVVPREWILLSNTNYLLRGINRAGTSQPMSATIQFYEQ